MSLPKLLHTATLATLVLSSLALATAPEPPTVPAPQETPPHPQEMDGIVVHAAPEAAGVGVAVPSEVLAGPALDAARASNLGATLGGMPGIHATGLGDAVGRPVIRGLDGARIAIASNGLGTGDASALGEDHAVTVNPFLAEEIRILKGPAALPYGGGAIGGVVDVVDGRIPGEVALLPFSGRSELRRDSAAAGNAASFRVDGGGGALAWHADAARRQADDYAIPGGRLANSDLDLASGAIGASLVGERGHVGASVARFLHRYGSPAEPGDPALGEGPARLHAAQTTLRVEGRLQQPLPGFEQAEFDFARGDYEHEELAGEEPETRFGNRSRELRLMLAHAPMAGWHGRLGLQWQARDFSALGEEAFVPPVRSDAAALFVVEERSFGKLGLALGARAERRQLRPEAGAARRTHPLDLAAEMGWEASEAWRWGLVLTRAERAPGEEELFASGPHHATGTWEIGDPTLPLERARAMELDLHYRSTRVDAHLAAWVRDFDDFIHLVDTGGEEDGLPVRHWSATPARFRGLEAEAAFHLPEGGLGHFDLRLQGDLVRAQQADGANLPRIPVARLGATLLWQQGGWRASLGTMHYFRQRHLAEHETPTAGFTRIDFDVSRELLFGGATRWEFFAQGRNLGNATIRLSTSLFKDVAPLPGRSLGVGLRGWF